jgi:hypothetical protein
MGTFGTLRAKKRTNLQIYFDKCKKKHIFLKKSVKKFAYLKNLLYLCTRLRELATIRRRLARSRDYGKIAL